MVADLGRQSAASKHSFLRFYLEVQGQREGSAVWARGPLAAALGAQRPLLQGHPQRRGSLRLPGCGLGLLLPMLGTVIQTWGQLSRPAAATGWLPSQDRWPLWPRSARGPKTKDLWSDCSPQGDSGLPGNSNVTMTLIIVMPPKTPAATQAQVPAG